MSSPCPVPRLFRCRVRDLASCFYACWLPLDEESDIRSKPSQTSNENVVFNSKRAVRSHRKSRKTSAVDRGESSVQSSSLTNSRGGRLDEPWFAEEDYIVFCFREDGGIHMIGEGKSSESYHESNEHENTTTTTTAATLRPINRKLRYGECVGHSWDSRGRGMIGRDNEDTEINQDEIPSLEIKDEEERSKEMESDDEIKEINPIEQLSASKMDSFESCDSTLSDTSTSSFAFPVLGIEWTGSPVHMPKTQRQEAPSVCLHCCRF
ncbi:protein BREAKING OF ASYMMETRY IN THE STOMATAL LINEAGE [Sesamum alatum]|uniref:Protein BREAKING OF ASYMMETRY IN THE STOMATAL LINEAGE n=1 Tax=Sesamum alatum TaxID=300844 RepID=A0AAE2CLU5_9LAMI|nr:protein BREAKING OF ASYMMETRY IN THE STOMATAL LINEAGE [Sesamum alatum]